MTLYDMNTEKVYTLPELKAEYLQFRSEEPWNHAENFRSELFEILMATVNGRNDCEVVGLTAHELSEFILKMHPDPLPLPFN